jgi:hypothetical protein
MEIESRFVVCIDNKAYPASLEFGKIYRVIADEKSDSHQMLRVIDESGEDYLYPERFFIGITLPQVAKEAFLALA